MGVILPTILFRAVATTKPLSSAENTRDDFAHFSQSKSQSNPPSASTSTPSSYSSLTPAPPSS